MHKKTRKNKTEIGMYCTTEHMTIGCTEQSMKEKKRPSSNVLIVLTKYRLH